MLTLQNVKSEMSEYNNRTIMAIKITELSTYLDKY